MRYAACRCEKLSITCADEPVRISVCHCLECQRRTGSAFGVQARFPSGSVSMSGAYSEFERTSDSGRWARYRFCPSCGSTVAYENEDAPGLIAVPVGAFADPGFPAPERSGFEQRRHRWVEIVGDHIEHLQDD